MKEWLKKAFGLLQLFFVVQLGVTFILFTTLLIHRNDNTTQKYTYLEVTLVALISLVPTAILISSLVVHMSLTSDLVGSFRVLQAGSSFKVALLSWVINVFVTILDFIAVVYCKGGSGPGPWQLTITYYSLFIVQQSCQIKCLYKLEMRTLLIREGPDWHRFRQAMFILMAFFNGLTWMISLSYMEPISDLSKQCMDDLLTASVFRIVHTVGRAATLAFRIESTLLFMKFFYDDKQSLTGMVVASPVVRPTTINHTEIGKGRWSAGFLATAYCGLALASFILGNHFSSKKLILATTACLLTSSTIMIICVRLQMSGSTNRVPLGPDDDPLPKGCIETMSVYFSGKAFSHTKLLTFYSVAAVTYHTVYALHLTMSTIEEEAKYRIVRESSKAVGCIFLGLFGMWMSHKRRCIRTWRPLHIMLWMIFTISLPGLR